MIYLSNLAAKVNADEIIKSELYLTGIPCVNLSKFSQGEVRASVYGYIDCGEFGYNFYRAWSYYVVQGFVDKFHAKVLQESSYKSTIRPTGHCAPEDYTKYLEWYDKHYQKINTLEHKAEFEEYKNSKGWCGEKSRELLSSLEFRAGGTKQGDRQFINLYHIDSLDGLKFFRDVIKS